ncbi:MAG: hypothetical protein QXO51_05745 [Halobacteria archaeon]
MRIILELGPEEERLLRERAAQAETTPEAICMMVLRLWLSKGGSIWSQRKKLVVDWPGLVVVSREESAPAPRT